MITSQCYFDDVKSAVYTIATLLYEFSIKQRSIEKFETT